MAESGAVRTGAIALGLVAVAVLLVLAWRDPTGAVPPRARVPGATPDPQPAGDAIATLDALAALARQAVLSLQRPDGTPRELFDRACALCHGSAGTGNDKLGTPSIAGQPGWYLRSQLLRFREGRRGGHPQDRAGGLMAGVARALPPAAVDGLAELIGAMAPVPTGRTLDGDPAHGRLVYEEQCMECHRYNGAGERAFQSSPLTSFQDWYLANELEEFRSGIRGHDPTDPLAGKMREVARYLDARSRRDVIVYIAELAVAHPPGR